MTFVKHELKQGKVSFLIWTISIGFLLAVCVFLFPEMKGQMDGISETFASMGSFTAAFGMDRLDFGTLIGFYAIECGNVLGLGGALYVALCAVNILSKEEKDKTAEFLKYITPFGYCDGADIVSNGNLDGTMVAIGIVMGIAGIAVAYLHYTRKDIC